MPRDMDYKHFRKSIEDDRTPLKDALALFSGLFASSIVVVTVLYLTAAFAPSLQTAEATSVFLTLAE